MSFKQAIENKLTTILFFGFIVMAFIMFQQCSSNSKLKAEIEFNKSEIERSDYNRKIDSSKMVEYFDEDGNLRAEKMPYKITYDELVNEYDSVFNLYQVEKGKIPEVLVKWKTKIKDSIIYISTSVTNEHIVLNDTADYNNGNYRILSGAIPYNIMRYNIGDGKLTEYDSTFNYPKLFTESGKFSLEQSMNLQIGFYEDENEDLLFDVTTDYPNVHFNGLVGAKVSDYDEFKKNTELPSSWRIGVSTGYGFYIDNVVSAAPFVGVGLMWTPPFVLKLKKKWKKNR